VTRRATQVPLDPSGVAAEGGRGLAAFLAYLATTRSPFTASTDAIWPRSRARFCACDALPVRGRHEWRSPDARWDENGG
jgi:hypothetical protein